MTSKQPLNDSPDFEFTALLETDHWFLEEATGHRVLRLRRTQTPLMSVEEVNDAFADLNRVLERFPLSFWGLLVDVRQSRPAHNSAIEKAFRDNRERSYRAFGRFGVLVASAAGVMQVTRMLRETPDPRIAVFTDELDALDWVRSKD